MDIQLTNEEIIERVNAWQNAGFVHPLTCRWSSKHGNLIPTIKDGKVILKCPDCKGEQLHIPPSVLQITPEQIQAEKERLISVGFKFDGQRDFRPSNRLDLMSKAEKAITDAMYELEEAGADLKLTEAGILLGKARELVYEYYKQSYINQPLK